MTPKLPVLHAVPYRTDRHAAYQRVADFVMALLGQLPHAKEKLSRSNDASQLGRPFLDGLNQLTEAAAASWLEAAAQRGREGEDLQIFTLLAGCKGERPATRNTLQAFARHAPEACRQAWRTLTRYEDLADLDHLAQAWVPPLAEVKSMLESSPELLTAAARTWPRLITRPALHPWLRALADEPLGELTLALQDAWRAYDRQALLAQREPVSLTYRRRRS